MELGKELHCVWVFAREGHKALHDKVLPYIEKRQYKYAKWNYKTDSLLDNSEISEILKTQKYNLVF